MSTSVAPHYNDFERQFVSIRDMNVETQYIDRNGYARSYCLIRQAVAYLGLLKFDIVRTLFRRCCSENIVTAKESIQRAITAYQQPHVASSLDLEARKQLLMAVATKVNAVIDRISLARQNANRGVIAPEIKFDLAQVEKDWTQSAKEITRHRVNSPDVASSGHSGPQPLLSSSLVLPQLNALTAASTAATTHATGKSAGPKKQP